MKPKFTDHESYYICKEVQNWRSEGMTDKEITSEKTQLIVDFGLDPEESGVKQAVDAISAHNRIRAWNRIADQQKRNGLKSEYGKSMYKDVDGVGGEERLEIQTIWAELLELEPDIVKGITDGVPPDLPPDYWGKDGTSVRYLNDKKLTYWDALRDFTLKHYPTLDVRQQLRVVCMSGIECHEPQRVYEDVGIPPSQIVCVENTKKRLPRTRFIRNCRARGYTAVNDTIQNYLQNNDQLVDILSIDPPGHFGKVITDSLQWCRMRQGLVFINMREQMDLIKKQAGFEALYKYLERMRSMMPELHASVSLESNSLSSVMEEDFRHSQVEFKSVLEDKSSRAGQLKTLRQNVVPFVVQYLLGANDDCGLSDSEKKLKNISPQNLVTPVFEVQKKFSIMLSQAYGKDYCNSVRNLPPGFPCPKAYVEFFCNTLGSSMSKLALRFDLNDQNFHRYNSGATASNAPYLTALFKVKSNEYYEGTKHNSVRQFLAKATYAIAQLFQSQDTNWRLDDKAFEIRLANHSNTCPPARKAVIEAVLNGQVVAMLKWKYFCGGIHNAAEAMRRASFDGMVLTQEPKATVEAVK